MSTVLSPTALARSYHISLQPATITEIMCKLEDVSGHMDRRRAIDIRGSHMLAPIVISTIQQTLGTGTEIDAYLYYTYI